MFFTKEQLMRKPLHVVQHLDIRTKEEENLVQEVVNIKMAQIGVDPTNISRRDVPDIKTKEEEEHWQAVIDERTAKATPKPIDVQLSEPELEAKVAEIDAQKAVVEQSIVDAGNTSPEGNSAQPVANLTAIQEPEATKIVDTAPVAPEATDPAAKQFCQFCDSRGVRHKLNCTRPQAQQ